MSEVGRLILEALFSCYWTTPRPHLYKRQKPWYILNLWEDLLASSWHKAVFLSLTVSGTRSDSLLKLKVPLRTSILTTSVGLILPMLICKMEMNMCLIELSWELHEIISVKHLELCLALSKPLITFTTIIVALHGWEGWDPERWNTLPEVTQRCSTPPYTPTPTKKEAELELESKSTTLCWRQLFFWHLWSSCNWELRFMCPQEITACGIALVLLWLHKSSQCHCLSAWCPVWVKSSVKLHMCVCVCVHVCVWWPFLHNLVVSFALVY